MDIYSLLSTHSIPYQRFDHPAVYTCEEAEQLTPDMPGAHTKNLFLRDKKGKRHILVAVGYDKAVDLQALGQMIDADKLGFGSPERLQKYLQLEPGSVSLLGLVNDEQHAVEVIIDQAIWDADTVLCHPLVNTATLAISHEGIEKFLAVTGHQANVMNVPERI